MAFHHSPQLVTENLVMLLDAANTKSYPGSGALITDLSGQGLNVTLSNSPTFDTANLGGLIYDGVNQFGSTNDVAYARFWHDQAWSVSFVVKLVSWVNTWPGIFKKGNSGASQPGVLLFYGSAGRLTWKHYNTSTSWDSLTLGVPAHITITFGAGTTGKLYVNGDYKSALPILQATETSSPIRFGQGDVYGNVEHYHWAKYSKELTASEVLQNCNALKGRFGK